MAEDMALSIAWLIGGGFISRFLLEGVVSILGAMRGLVRGI